MEDDASVFLEELDDRARGVACGLNDADAGVDDSAGIGVVVWRHEGGEESDVHAEGVGR